MQLFLNQENTKPDGRSKWIKKMWYIYIMEYYSAIKRRKSESVEMRWTYLEPVIQSEVSQKEKSKYCILTHIDGIQKYDTEEPTCRAAVEMPTESTDNGLSGGRRGWIK